MNPLSAEEILQRWGLRRIGGSLTSPIRLSTGAEAGLDDDLVLLRYVESLPGFERAKPVLNHVYSHGKPPGAFVFRFPGEPKSRALIRHGWFDLIHLPDREIPIKVLEEFRRELEAAIRLAPIQSIMASHKNAA